MNFLNTKLVKKFLIRAACLLMVTATVWSGAFVSGAQADSFKPTGSERAGEIMNDRAAAELDRVAGAGVSDRVEGAVDGAVGSVKRNINRVGDDLNVDSAANRLDAATDELTGKVKRDIGRTKSAASEIGEDLEESSEGIVDSIKDLFN